MAETQPGNDLLSKLEAWGDPRKGFEWHKRKPDYVAELGLQDSDIPALLSIARQWVEREEWLEDENDMTVYAPVHAWRCLAQLRAEEAIDTMIEMMVVMDEREDDWHMEEFPQAFGMIGPASIKPLEKMLAEKSQGLYIRACAAQGLRRVAEHFPDSRSEAVQLLTAQLSHFNINDPALNGFLIGDLLDLKASESAEVIERAFAALRVEEQIAGDWFEVRKELKVEDLGLMKEQSGRQASPSSTGLGSRPSERERQREKRKKERRNRRRGRRK